MAKHKMYVRIDAYVEFDAEIPEPVDAHCPEEKWTRRGYAHPESANLEDWEFGPGRREYLDYHASMRNQQKCVEKYMGQHLAEYPGINDFKLETKFPLPTGKKRARLNILPIHNEIREKLRNKWEKESR